MQMLEAHVKHKKSTKYKEPEETASQFLRFLNPPHYFCREFVLRILWLEWRCHCHQPSFFNDWFLVAAWISSAFGLPPSFLWTMLFFSRGLVSSDVFQMIYVLCLRSHVIFQKREALDIWTERYFNAPRLGLSTVFVYHFFQNEQISIFKQLTD